MMGEASEAVAALHAGGEDGGGGVATGGCWVSGSTAGSASASSGIGTASSGSSSSSSSLFSSTTTWSVGDEDEDGDCATSSSRPAADRRRRHRHFSSLSSSSSSSMSSESEASQMNGAAGGPLYGMSTMRDDLPPAQGLRYVHARAPKIYDLGDHISLCFGRCLTK